MRRLRMTRELIDTLNKMKECLLNGTGISLNRKELHLVIKYINDLEIEISGGYETND